MDFTNKKLIDWLIKMCYRNHSANQLFSWTDWHNPYACFITFASLMTGYVLGIVLQIKFGQHRGTIKAGPIAVYKRSSKFGTSIRNKRTCSWTNTTARYNFVWYKTMQMIQKMPRKSHKHKSKPSSGTKRKRKQISHVTRKPSSEIRDHLRLKLACSATESN